MQQRQQPQQQYRDRYTEQVEVMRLRMQQQRQQQQQQQQQAEDSDNAATTPQQQQHPQNHGTNMHPVMFPTLSSAVLGRQIGNKNSNLRITVLHPYLCALVFLSLFITAPSAYVIGALLVLDVPVDYVSLLFLHIVSMFGTISFILYIMLELCDGNIFIQKQEEQHHGGEEDGCGCLHLAKKFFL